MHFWGPPHGWVREARAKAGQFLGHSPGCPMCADSLAGRQGQGSRQGLKATSTNSVRTAWLGAKGLRPRRHSQGRAATKHFLGQSPACPNKNSGRGPGTQKGLQEPSQQCDSMGVTADSACACREGEPAEASSIPTWGSPAGSRPAPADPNRQESGVAGGLRV